MAESKKWLWILGLGVVGVAVFASRAKADEVSPIIIHPLPTTQCNVNDIQIIRDNYNCPEQGRIQICSNGQWINKTNDTSSCDCLVPELGIFKADSDLKRTNTPILISWVLNIEENPWFSSDMLIDVNEIQAAYPEQIQYGVWGLIAMYNKDGYLPLQEKILVGEYLLNGNIYFNSMVMRKTRVELTVFRKCVNNSIIKKTYIKQIEWF